MAEAVFWDTAAFVALGNRDDDLHTLAVAISAQLAQERKGVVTSDAVLVEVLNTFSQVRWRTVARAWVDAIQRSAATDAARLVHVDENLWQRAWRLFVARADKDWSMTDCISFVIMQDHGLSRAFTSDKHFEQAGFARLIISPA